MWVHLICPRGQARATDQAATTALKGVSGALALVTARLLRLAKDARAEAKWRRPDLRTLSL